MDVYARALSPSAPDAVYLAGFYRIKMAGHPNNPTKKTSLTNSTIQCIVEGPSSKHEQKPQSHSRCL